MKKRIVSSLLAVAMIMTLSLIHIWQIMRITALSPVPWKALRKMESCMAFPEIQTWPASIIMRKCLRITAGMYPQRMMNY